MEKQKSPGFTLIELIVAIAIIGMLAAVTLAGFSQGTKKRGVVLASDTILSVLHAAQSDSQNPQAIPNDSCTPDSLPVEYRVVFTSSSPTYTLLAKDKCGTSKTLQSGALPNRVIVSTGSYMTIDSTSLGGGGTLSIKFLPPFASMSAAFNSDPLKSFGQATVRVESSDGQVTQKIIIDGVSGRFDVQ